MTDDTLPMAGTTTLCRSHLARSVHLNLGARFDL